MNKTLAEYATISQLVDVYKVLFAAIKRNDEAIIDLCTNKITELKSEL